MARARRRLDCATAFILVLVASWQCLATDERGLLRLATHAAVLFATWWFSVLWHEIGHAALARAAGLDPYAILVGSGRTVVRLTCRRITLDCGWFPGSGLTMFGPARIDHVRGRTVLALAGGPIATILLITGALYFSLRESDFGDATLLDRLRAIVAGHGTRTSAPWNLIASALVACNSLLLITLASPMVRRWGPLAVPSDLSAILRMLKHRGAAPVGIDGWSRQRDFARSLALRQYDDAERLALAILHTEPDRERLRADLVRMLYLAGRYAEAAGQFEELVRRNPRLNEARIAEGFVAAAIDYARACLHLGGTVRVRTADHWSAYAISVARSHSRVMTTRGAVLAERGEFETAEAQIADVRQLEPTRRLRAECCAVEALVAARRGMDALAAERLARARELDPTCELLPLVPLANRG